MYGAAILKSKRQSTQHLSGRKRVLYGGEMRKDIIGDQPVGRQSHDDADWLDVERVARVQLTSEDPAFPIEKTEGPGPA
jgi:hypothetical protein